MTLSARNRRKTRQTSGFLRKTDFLVHGQYIKRG
jgi:hypothetical protein